MNGLEEMLETCTAFLECSAEKELVWVHIGGQSKKALDIMDDLLSLEFFKTIYITDDATFVCPEKAHLVTCVTNVTAVTAVTAVTNVTAVTATTNLPDPMTYLHPETGVIGILSQGHISHSHPYQRLYQRNSYGKKPYCIWIGNLNGVKRFVQPHISASPSIYLSAFTYTNNISILNIDDLDIQPTHVCLLTTSLGCHAFKLLENVAHVTSMDPNPTHNAILELEAIAIQEWPYEKIQELFTKGHHPKIKELLPYLSESTRSFWLQHQQIVLPFAKLSRECIDHIKEQRLLERLTISTNTLSNELKIRHYDKIIIPTVYTTP